MDEVVFRRAGRRPVALSLGSWLSFLVEKTTEHRQDTSPAACGDVSGEIMLA